VQSALWTRAWLLSTWLDARRKAGAGDADVARHLYRHQTRGMNLRLSEWLRDRLRPSWLRLRGSSDDA
jgi:hypothetical protein